MRYAPIRELGWVGGGGGTAITAELWFHSRARQRFRPRVPLSGEGLEGVAADRIDTTRCNAPKLRRAPPAFPFRVAVTVPPLHAVSLPLGFGCRNS